MSRIRYIKPTIGTDEDLAQVSIAARYLFAMLPTMCDREGRMEDSPRIIKLSTFPWDNVDVDALLNELAGHHLIRYKVGNKSFLSLFGFVKHQRPHPSEFKSKIPAPPTTKIRKHFKKCFKISNSEVMSREEGLGTGEEGLGTGELAAAPKAERPPVKDASPKPLTSVQKIMRAFKDAKGIDMDDVEWDKKHFSRFARSANDVLKIFGGDPHPAITYILAKGSELDEKGLNGWGLEAIARGAAIDPRVQDLIQGEKTNGPENSALDANRMDGPGRPRRITRAGEIVGDALAGLRKQAEVRGGEPSTLAGPSADRLDDEPFEP